MGLWTLTIADDSDAAGQVLLLCSTSMRPLALPLFRDEEQAEAFLDFAREAGYRDVRALGHDTLDRLHSAWMRADEPDLGLVAP